MHLTEGVGRLLSSQRRVLLGCLFFFVCAAADAQNLIHNPSFELVDSCPELPILGYGPGERPVGWFTANSSPDYFNRCQPYGNYGGVPLNIGGWQEPVDGDAYSGMFTYFHNNSLFHEMIGTELADPLTVGSTYYLSFYVNAAAGGSEWPMLASSHFGALFTMDAVEWQNWMPSLPLRNYAQVYQSEVISDTLSWYLITGSFVADSAYRYMVLGNHFDNGIAQADTIIAQDSLAFLYRAYTYVDQVCLSTDPLSCPVPQGIGALGSASIQLYPNPATRELIVAGIEPDLTLTFVDALGRVQWTGLSGGNQVRLDVHGWSRGLYVVMMEHRGELHSMKFVLVE